MALLNHNISSSWTIACSSPAVIRWLLLNFLCSIISHSTFSECSFQETTLFLPFQKWVAVNKDLPGVLWWRSGFDLSLVIRDPEIESCCSNALLGRRRDLSSQEALLIWYNTIQNLPGNMRINGCGPRLEMSNLNRSVFLWSKVVSRRGLGGLNPPSEMFFYLIKTQQKYNKCDSFLSVEKNFFFK